MEKIMDEYGRFLLDLLAMGFLIEMCIRDRLPDEENLSESDTFNGEKKDVYVYFENTAELDAGNLPLQAQAEQMCIRDSRNTMRMQNLVWGIKIIIRNCI